MKKAAIIQARMGSSRLPGKVLKTLNGVTVLETVVRRVRQAQLLDDIIVATTSSESDEPIAVLCERLNVKYHRGPENDVMARYYEAAKRFNIGVIVRVTSDCPLVDPFTINQLVERFEKQAYDYILKDNLPVGTTSEIFSYQALENAYLTIQEKYHREHIVTAFTEYPDHYRSYIYDADDEYKYPALRLTLDTQEDYELLVRIFESFDCSNDEIPLIEVIELLKTNPSWQDINAAIKQKDPTVLNW
jgi:spore coat polysaccharide biosynthesis protein SpsF